MGDDDADEADEAADRHRRRRAERGGEHHDQPYLAGVYPQCCGFLVAHGEHVERSAVAQHHRSGQHEVRQQQRRLGPSRGRDPAEDPGEDLAERVAVGLQRVGLAGGQEAGHGDARQDQRRSGAPAEVARRVRHRDGQQRSGECGKRNRVEGAGPVAQIVGDGERRTEPCTGGDAEQVGVGQRVAEGGLIGGAAHRQSGSHEQPEHDAWQPDPRHDGGVRVAEPRLDGHRRQRIEQFHHHPMSRDADGPDGQPGADRDRDGCQRRAQMARAQV